MPKNSAAPATRASTMIERKHAADEVDDRAAAALRNGRRRRRGHRLDRLGRASRHDAPKQAAPGRFGSLRVLVAGLGLIGHVSCFSVYCFNVPRFNDSGYIAIRFLAQLWQSVRTARSRKNPIAKYGERAVQDSQAA